MSSARKVPRLDERQFDLFSGVPSAVQQRALRTALDSERRFVSGHPDEMFVGTVRLEQYLRASGELAALKVARLLDEQDWQVFEQRYAATGRAPYAPRCMMGLILVRHHARSPFFTLARTPGSAGFGLMWFNRSVHLS